MSRKREKSRRRAARLEKERLEQAEIKKQIRRYQIIDLINLTAVLIFINVRLIPSVQKKWAVAPWYVYDVGSGVVFATFLAHLLHGPYRGPSDIKSYLKYYKIQALIHSIQTAANVYTALWIFNFPSVVSYLLSSTFKPRVVNLLSWLFSAMVSGLIGNFTYDMFKRTFRKMSLASETSKSSSPARR